MAYDGPTHAPAGAALRVDEFKGASGLVHIADDLQRLFERIENRHFVHSPGWLRAFVACLVETPDKVRFFVFHRGAHVCAVVALQEQDARAAGPFRVRRHSLLMHRHATLSDALVAPGESVHEVVAALAGHLDGGALATLIELPNLLAGGAALSALGQGARLAPRLFIEVAGASAWFDTSSREAAFSGLSSHMRRNLARQRRRLEEMGPVAFERIQGERAATDGVERFVMLEASGWKGAAGSAIRMHPRILDFYRTLARELEGNPQVVVYLLAIGSRTVAGSFCIELDDTLHVLKIAYDEELHAAAPGNYLLDRMLDEAAASGVLRRVSLVTSPPWAQRWGARNDDLLRVLVFPPGLRGALLQAALRARRVLRRKPAQDTGIARAAPPPLE